MLLQQDITRGRDMVDALYQGAVSSGGTHNAIMSSEEYLSQVSAGRSNSPGLLDKYPRPILVMQVLQL